LLAWLNIVLHLAGLATAAIGMRPGTTLVPLRERMEYLAQSPPGWTLGWATWMLCAAALLWFLAAVSQRLENRAGPASVALMIAIAGVSFDLFCDSLYILLFPSLAALGPSQEVLFQLVEKATGIASMVIANGGYSIAILLFTVEFRQRRDLIPGTVPVGYAVAGFGLLLAAAAFTGVPWHAEWATPPTIGSFCVWVVLVAYSFEPVGRKP
jgi:hypothetical protein